MNWKFIRFFVNFVQSSDLFKPKSRITNSSSYFFFGSSSVISNSVECFFTIAHTNPSKLSFLQGQNLFFIILRNKHLKNFTIESQIGT